MKFIRKHIGFVLVLLFTTIGVGESYAQNFSETPEHKRMWRIFGRKKRRDAYNPNISKNTNKTKGLESKKLAKENKRVEKQQKKQIRRQKRHLRRTKGAYKKNK